MQNFSPMVKEISTNEILTGGENYIGTRAIERNTKAIMQVYNSIKTSFGPLGLDKMCVDAAGEVSITNDGATILQNMLVEDPAAKILLDLAIQQDLDVGDGTTGVVLLAANLIDKGSKLISSGLHASVVVSGYRMAFNECVHYIKTTLAKKISALSPAILENIVRTSISSKILKNESEAFTKMAIDAIQAVGGTKNNKPYYDLADIKILKHMGGAMKNSFLHRGFALNCSLASDSMPKLILKPKILCIDRGLQKYKLPLTANVLVDDPEKLEDIRQKEISITKERVQRIIDSGINVILSTKGLDDMCIKMLSDNNIMAIRRCKKEDLEVIARNLGTVLHSDISSESSDGSLTFGVVDKVAVEAIGSESCVLIHGMKKKMASIILRGANTVVLDEMHRSLHDALSVLKRTLELETIVPGGGAVECALSILLEKFVSTVSSKEHVAIHRYAESLLCIPKLLASNAGLDGNELLAELMGKQYRSKMSGGNSFLGLDVCVGNIIDNLENGVVEPSIIKLKALRSATEAAISILRINEIIVLPPDEK